MSLQEVLKTSIELATKLHSGQLDKAQEPYIGHPLRIMEGVSI